MGPSCVPSWGRPGCHHRATVGSIWEPSLEPAWSRLFSLTCAGIVFCAFMYYSCNSILEPSHSPCVLPPLLQSLQPSYKQRFAIKIGDNIRLVPTAEILYFESQHQMTYLTTEAGKRYPVQYTLQELEDLVDAKQFFRINRQVLLRDRSIQGVAMISNSRLKVKVPFAKEDWVVSRERCQDFKDWLNQ